MRTITRTTNPNGTYRYEIDGELVIKASKVEYTHASTYSVDDHAAGMTYPTLFHKTESAAKKATGYRRNGWVKTGVQAIEIIDPANVRIYAVTQVSPTTGKPLRGAPTRKYRASTAREAGRLYAAGQGLPNPVLAAHYDGNAENEFFTFRPTAPQGSFLRVRVQQVTETDESIGGIPIHESAAIFGMCLRYANRNGIDYWALTSDEKFALEDKARAAESPEPAAEVCRECEALGWKSLCPSCTARTLDQAPSVSAAIKAPKPPRNRAKVIANAGPSHLRGREGRVQSKGRGEDGILYVTVDFGNDVTWPFLVSELTIV